MADYHDERREHFSLPDPPLPRGDAAGPWPFPDPRLPTTNHFPSAAQLGAAAVAGAMGGFVTDMPFAGQARGPCVPGLLDDIEKALVDLRQRVAGVRYQLNGEALPCESHAGAGDVVSRMVCARSELSDIMGDLSAIEAALGLREG